MYAEAGTYNVCLVANNSLGCTDTVCQDVELKADWTLYIPNSFSPNEDGVNETFNTYSSNCASIEMYVYDRWGGQIFYSDDPAIGWNGKWNNSGEDVALGVYVYKVIVIDNTRGRHFFVGHVNLIR